LTTGPDSRSAIAARCQSSVLVPSDSATTLPSGLKDPAHAEQAAGTVTSPGVDLAAVSEGHDDDEEHVTGDGVDNAVVTDPNAQTGATLQGTRGRRARRGSGNVVILRTIRQRLSFWCSRSVGVGRVRSPHD